MSNKKELEEIKNAIRNLNLMKQDIIRLLQKFEDAIFECRKKIKGE